MVKKLVQILYHNLKIWVLLDKQSESILLKNKS
jgi:hypothetical protein